MSIFDNPYLKQLSQGSGVNANQGIIGNPNPESTWDKLGASQALLKAGGSILQNNGGDTFGAIGNGINAFSGAIDEYNKRINQNAYKDATFNLQAAGVIGDVNYKNESLGLEKQKLGILQAKADRESQLNSTIQNMILGGSGATQQASQPYENPSAGMTMASGSTSILPQPKAQDPNQIMAVGALTKNPALVSYGEQILKQQTKQDKELNQGVGTIRQASTVFDDIEEAKRLIGEGDIVTGQLPVTGTLGSVAAYFPGGNADRLDNTLQSIRANVTFDKLAELKKLSTSGASGLGSTTEKEIDLLQSSIANLKIRQGEKALQRNLGKVETHYNNILNDLQRAGIDPARYGFVAGKSDPLGRRK